MFVILDMDIIWMHYALIVSNLRNLSNDVTVGAVLVYNGRLVGYGQNASIMSNDPSAHAEILALRMGGKILGNYRLLNTILYVTLEPCMMCIGAMIHARIFKLVCGAKNYKSGWLYLLYLNSMLYNTKINHCIFVKTGVLKEVCSDKIGNFFKCLRKNRKKCIGI